MLHCMKFSGACVNAKFSISSLFSGHSSSLSMENSSHRNRDTIKSMYVLAFLLNMIGYDLDFFFSTGADFSSSSSSDDLPLPLPLILLGLTAGSVSTVALLLERRTGVRFFLGGPDTQTGLAPFN